MKAELVALSVGCWRLVGQVDFSTAENLADRKSTRLNSSH